MNIPFLDLKSNYNSIKKEINLSMQHVLNSTRFIKGPFLEKFEKDFASYIGVKYCIGVASGTDALHLSLVALGITKGDEVILPANTFAATVYAILYCGAKPVLVDVDERTHNIRAEDIEKVITKKTKAIIPVHLYGTTAEMNLINKLANIHNLSVLEDACQSHGATYGNKKTGNLGDAAAFSFYPGKNLGAYGDGGAITTNSLQLATQVRKLREYGSLTKYSYEMVGFNSRLDALQAAVLSVKIKHLDAWNSQRRSVANYYTTRFNQELPFILTPQISKKHTSVYHLYVIQTKQRDALANYLHKQGIETGIHYPIPLHLQPSLQSLGYKKGDFPITESLSSQILSLPIYPELQKKQQDYIFEQIAAFFKK